MNRFFHVAGIVFAAALVLPIPAPLLCLIGAFALAGSFMKKPPLWVLAAAAAFCICGFVRMAAMPLPGFTGTIQGLVLEREDSGGYSTLTLAVREGQYKDVKIALHMPVGLDGTAGDVVEYTGIFEPGGNLLYAKGISFSSFSSGAPHVVGECPGNWQVRLERHRMQLRSALRRMLPQGEGDILAAMLLGKTQGLPNGIRHAYANAGLAHLLSVSGMHLTILIQMFGLFLQSRLFSRRQRLFLEALLAAAFAFLTGFPYAMRRAVIMLVIARLACLLGRDPDALNALGLAAILILCQNPYAVYSVGFQLTYLSSMGIAAFLEPMQEGLSRIFCKTDWYLLYEAKPRMALFLSTLCVAPAAQVLSFPVQCWYFGRAAWAAPLSSLLAALPAAAALGAGLLSIGAFFLSGASLAARWFAFCAGLAIRCVNGVSTLFSSCSVPLQSDAVILWITAATGIFIVIIFVWRAKEKGKLILWSVELAACSLAALLLAQGVVWGAPLVLSAARYGNTMALVYGGQAALIGAPENMDEAELLLELFKDSKTESLCLFVPEKREETLAAPSLRLCEEYPPEKIAPLDGSPFKAVLFGGITLIPEPGRSAVRIQAGSLEIVKAFDHFPANAHLLADRENSLIMAGGVKFCQNDRYYNSTRLFFRGLEDLEDEV